VFSLGRSNRLRAGVVAAAVVSVAVAGCSSSSTSGAPAASSAAPASSAAASSSAPASSPPAAASSVAPPVSSTAPAAPASSTAPTPGLQGFLAASVSFVSADDGFVIGTAPCSAGSCTTLAKTTDAGHTWTDGGTLPPSLVGASQGVQKVRFADANDGWAFDPQLWSTHDGGATWKQVPETASVDDVEASAGVVYADVGSTLVRSPVGSDAFTPVAGAPEGSGSITLHGKAVWLTLSSSATAGDLVISPDGVSWHTVTDPCAGQPDQLGLAGIAPVTATSVYLLCAGDAGAGSTTKAVLFSTDGGVHGTPTTAAPPRGGDPSGFTAASTGVVVVSARSGATELYRTASRHRPRAWRSTGSRATKPPRPVSC
jgi:photosystem II stability/assembly factor-like uncharacterized protein